MYSSVSVRNEQGSALFVVVVVAALCAVVVAGLSMVGRAALEAARAQTVADAGALAGSVAGRSGAERVVGEGSGTIVSATSSSYEFDIVVRVGEAAAAARARSQPPTVGVGDRSGLAPAMLAALARAEELGAGSIPVVSGYRSRAAQEVLWARRVENPYPVALPGTSRHELGLAIDVPLSAVAALARVAALAGLCHPLPERDPVHFIVCPTDR